MLVDGFTVFGSWPGLTSDYPVENLINGLERFKVTHACTLSSKGIFLDAAIGNQETWEACKQDKRLIPIGVADPRLGGVEQVDYCAQQGFKIMALFPTSQNWSFANITVRAILERMAEHNLPVLIEAGREGDASAIIEAAHGLTLAIIFSDVSLRTLAELISICSIYQQSPSLRALKVPIGEVISTLRGGLDIYLATRLLCGGDTIEYLSQQIGAYRLVFTSRFPVSCFSSAFLTAQYAQLDSEQRAAIMGGNLMRLLG